MNEHSASVRICLEEPVIGFISSGTLKQSLLGISITALESKVLIYCRRVEEHSWALVVLEQGDFTVFHSLIHSPIPGPTPDRPMLHIRLDEGVAEGSHGSTRAIFEIRGPLCFDKAAVEIHCTLDSGTAQRIYQSLLGQAILLKEAR